MEQLAAAAPFGYIEAEDGRTYYLIVVLEDDKILFTAPGTEYYPVLKNTGFLDTLIYFGDLDTYFKQQKITTHSYMYMEDEQLQIKAAYIYDYNCSYDQKKRILRSIFKN